MVYSRIKRLHPWPDEREGERETRQKLESHTKARKDNTEKQASEDGNIRREQAAGVSFAMRKNIKARIRYLVGPPVRNALPV